MRTISVDSRFVIESVDVGEGGDPSVVACWPRCYRGRHLSVTVTAATATYELLDGPPLTIAHHGSPVELAERSVALAIPLIEATPAPTQPSGRSPARRATAQPVPTCTPGRAGTAASGR